MSQDPNRRPTSPWETGAAPAAEPPAAGPEAAGDHAGAFPHDEALEKGKEAHRPTAPAPGSAGSGAPQAVDPGLADQPAGGPAERLAWDHEAAGGTAGTLPHHEPAAAPTTGNAVDHLSPDRFRERWPSVQGAFVDDPRNAVAEADQLVAEVIQDVEQQLTRRRQNIRDQWTGGEPDTEQLRRTMHGYRALFHRLLESEL